MKTLLTIIASMVIFFQSSTLETLRNLYPTAGASKANSAKFAVAAEKAGSSDATVKVYKSAAKIIQAKFETGPDRKSLISDGIKGVESAIAANPANIEMRLIRLSIQENLPKVVGYNSKMAEDKNVILRNYSKQNSALKSYIREFAAVSKTIKPTEKATLK